jgi:hypothetical protein
MIMLAAVPQVIICRSAGFAFSWTTAGFLMAGWLVGAVLLGFNAPDHRLAFYPSLGLSLQAISFSMIGCGFLETRGFLHASSFGRAGCAIHKVLRDFKPR